MAPCPDPQEAGPANEDETYTTIRIESSGDGVCPFQKRFKQAPAVAFLRSALERLVSSVVEAAGIELRGPFARFTDVRVYDKTSTALAREIPPEQLRQVACLHVARAFAREIVDSFAMSTPAFGKRVLRVVADSFATLAREVRPSRSRPRIALRFGAVGA